MPKLGKFLARKELLDLIKLMRCNVNYAEEFWKYNQLIYLSLVQKSQITCVGPHFCMKKKYRNIKYKDVVQ